MSGMGWPQIILIGLLALAFLSAIFDKEQDRRNFWAMLVVTAGFHCLLWWGGFYTAAPAVLAGTLSWTVIWPQLGVIAISLVRLVRFAISHGTVGDLPSPIRFVIGATPHVALLFVGGFFS